MDPEAWALVNEVYAVDLRTLGYETRAAPAKASETNDETFFAELGAAPAESARRKSRATREKAVKRRAKALVREGYERSWDWPKCYFDPRNVAGT